MAMLAFALLIGALLMFLTSTRQWALWARGLAWGGGMALLVLAWLLLGSSERDPELAIALADLAANFLRPGESLLIRMLESNGAMVAHLILSLFDIFLFFALVVSILALIAFRPGEEMEKALRPIMTVMIGAIMGGLFALALVGTGFGEREQRQAYAGPVQADTVFTADTVLLGGDLLRLRGIDAPEPGQPCRIGGRTQDCGEEATRALRRMLQGAFLMCALEAPDLASPATSQQRVATCSASLPTGQEFIVARAMVEDGYALPVGDTYFKEGEAAKLQTRGLLSRCMVRPDAWAALPQRRKADFAERGIYPPDTPLVGACPPPKAPVRRRPPQRNEAVTPVRPAPD